MPDNETLFALHDKFRFFERMPQDTEVRFPATRRVASPDEVQLDSSTRKTVLKPVHSRFGRSVVRGVREGSLNNLRIGADYPWVQQEFIAGQGVCNYAVCRHGKVLAHAAYRPRYLLNGAAATYFEPLHDPRLEDFVAQFAAQNVYHGQAAFDFIDDGIDLWRDFRRAEDVIAGLPARAQWLAFGEMLWRSVKYRKPLTSASTFDIEFDGDGN